ncbi:hypothetical protein [Halocatena halophila]|uniref:hypothetical protein n=1 Tax=Halocatena halophila TaxID=2814576 RepID=UPI002ED23A0C
MTRTLRTALTALLVAMLVAGGAGTAAAESTDINSGDTSVVNDNDLVDVDDTLNNISANVLGIQVDDSELNVLSDDDDHHYHPQESTEINSGGTTVVNDNDLVELDETANNISANVLGVQVDDSDADILSA